MNRSIESVTQSCWGIHPCEFTRRVTLSLSLLQSLGQLDNPTRGRGAEKIGGVDTTCVVVLVSSSTFCDVIITGGDCRVVRHE